MGCLLLQLMLQPSCYRTGPDDNHVDRMTCFLLSNPHGKFPSAAWNRSLWLREIKKAGQRQRVRLMLKVLVLLVCVCRSVVSSSLWFHGLQPGRLLPLSTEFSSKNTGVGSHSLFQGILQNQGSNLGLLHCRQILYPLSHQGRAWETLLLSNVVILHWPKSSFRFFCTTLQKNPEWLFWPTW